MACKKFDVWFWNIKNTWNWKILKKFTAVPDKALRYRKIILKNTAPKFLDIAPTLRSVDTGTKSWRHPETQWTQSEHKHGGIFGRWSTDTCLCLNVKWNFVDFSSLNQTTDLKFSKKVSSNVWRTHAKFKRRRRGWLRLHELSAATPWTPRHLVKMDKLSSRMARKMGGLERRHFVVL